MRFTIWVAWLSGRWPEGRWPYVRRSSRHSFRVRDRADRFQRAEHRSSLLPVGQDFSPLPVVYRPWATISAVVSQIIDRQALARRDGRLGPFTVELFAIGRLTRMPGTVVPGSACRHAKTPCAGARSTNSTRNEPSPTPVGGFVLAATDGLASTHQLCDMTAWTTTFVQVCPHRPRSARTRKTSMDRT